MRGKRGLHTDWSYGACDILACGKGNCTISSNQTLGFYCECDEGWKQFHVGDHLRFMPCIFPTVILIIHVKVQPLQQQPHHNLEINPSSTLAHGLTVEVTRAQGPPQLWGIDAIVKQATPTFLTKPISPILVNAHWEQLVRNSE
ncbi:hypothetical protein ACLOJK_020465 [Asimina triloba]